LRRATGTTGGSGAIGQRSINQRLLCAIDIGNHGLTGVHWHVGAIIDHVLNVCRIAVVVTAAHGILLAQALNWKVRPIGVDIIVVEVVGEGAKEEETTEDTESS